MIKNKSLKQKVERFFNDKTTMDRQLLAIKKSVDEVSSKLKGEDKKKGRSMATIGFITQPVSSSCNMAILFLVPG